MIFCKEVLLEVRFVVLAKEAIVAEALLEDPITGAINGSAFGWYARRLFILRVVQKCTRLPLFVADSLLREHPQRFI